MRRQSERPVSPLVAPNRRNASPSAPVDGKAFSIGKDLHIAGFVGELTERGSMGLVLTRGPRATTRSLRASRLRSVNSLGTPAACEAEAMLSHKEKDHSCRHDYRGGLRLSGVARPRCSFRHLADVACRSSLASAAVVAASGVLHSPSRVGRLASRRDGLDGRTVSVFRRLSVPHRDVGVGGRARVAVVVVAARAVLPGVQGVVS